MNSSIINIIVREGKNHEGRMGKAGFDEALPSTINIQIYYKMLRFCINHYFSSIKAFNSSKNYYKILNVTETAIQKDIKKSFRELAKKYHPDSNKGKQEAFKEVNEAYQVLSDESIKRDYDEERRLTQRSSSPHYEHHPHESQGQEQYQNQQQSQSNNYRGYQRDQGWQNRSFRQQFMYDLYRTQQAEFNRNFSEIDRMRFDRQFREKMERQARANPSDTIRKYSEQAKRKQAEARKKYQEEERMHQERQKMEFRKYQDETYHDAGDKMKEKINKVADGIANNVKEFLSVTEEIKTFWNNIKKKK